MHEAKSPSDVLEYLSPQLVRILGGLDGAPESVAQATVQLLPFGSRAALEALGLAVAGDEIDDTTHRYLKLTPLAFLVMAEAAHRLDAPDALDEDLDQRAARALGLPAAVAVSRAAGQAPGSV